MTIVNSRREIESEASRTESSSISRLGWGYWTVPLVRLSNTSPPTKTRARLDSDCYAVLAPLLHLARLSLRSESATSSDGVSPGRAGPFSELIGGSPNAIWVIVLGCVLDSASVVQPLPLTLEAFLSDNINLDIMSGESLFRRTVSISGRWGRKGDHTQGAR